MKFKIQALTLVLFSNSLNAATLRVHTEIDGLSQLVIRPGQIHWNHLSAAIPGYGSQFTNAPTLLNNLEWYPVWPTPELCCSSAVSEPLNVNVLLVATPVGLQKTLGRGGVSIVQQPSSGNGFTLIVQFDDLGIPGADWYEVMIEGVALSPELSLSVEVSEITLRWIAETNKVYQLQYRPAASNGDWSNFGEVIPGNGELMSVRDPLGRGNRVYRVYSLPAP